MKKIFLPAILILTVLISAGCNKSNNTSDNTTTEKKTTETKTNSASDNSVKPALFTVKSVEEVKGKNMSPNVTWSEDGKDVSLKDMKGNVVMLNLWATWCGPCKKEL